MSPHTHCLVTGGAGFIGSHLAAELVRRGAAVRIVDNLSTGRLSNIAEIRSSVEFIQGDLCEPEVAQAAVDGMQIVFHLAALPSVPLSIDEPWRAHDANVNATVRLLEACVDHPVSRFVFSSSCAVYGDAPEIPKREVMAVEVVSPYAAAKLASEQYVLAFTRAGKLNGVALRYFNVFGPRQDPDSPYSAVIPRFLRAVANGEPVTVYGDGTQTRDFVYVSDVVNANLLAAWEPAAPGQVFNIGSGRQVSLNSLLDRIAGLTGTNPRRINLPKRHGDVLHSVADINRAGRILGYRPELSLDDGLELTWASMAEPMLEGASA